jgi:hypothetical protein
LGGLFPNAIVAQRSAEAEAVEQATGGTTHGRHQAINY